MVLFFVKNFILKYKDDLSGFVMEVMRDHPKCVFMMEHIRPQFEYLCNTDRSIAVDFVGRFEKINEDWEVVREKLGIEETLPHTNHSTRSHYSKHYTTEAAEVVGKVYREDIEIFDYQYASG